jgi:hypothetical protein
MYNFTQEDLLQYLYNETSPEKTAAIKAALISDWSLCEKLEVLASAHHQIDEIKLISPSKKSVNAILKYAEKSVSILSEHE